MNPLAPSRWVFPILGALICPAMAAPVVVINEIHYDPEPKTEHVEFVELYNAGDETADLSGWRFNNGIDHTFGDDVLLEPDSYLVLTESKAAFDKKFGSVFAGGKKAFGSWSDGVLSNDGERVTLVDAAGALVDEVNYRSEFPWPIGANGDGVSMELIHPELDNNLGGSWRSAVEKPTPNEPNSTLIDNAPPLLRQVDHDPKMPAVDAEATITVKVTDSDGVDAVNLLYQVVQPGSYIPAFLAKSTAQLRSNPEDPREPNPEFENPDNWTTVAMVDDGTNGDVTAGDAIYTAVLPGQSQARTVVRYRIEATDSASNSVRVPHVDDGSLNFAYYVYNGVPEYVAADTSVHPDGAPHTYPAEVMNSLPVYTLVADEDDFEQAVAYNGSDQITRDNFGARSAFNWSGTFVYDGVVYDNIKFRLRQRNDRYGGSGKRSMRFRFNRGHYPRLTDVWGNPLPERTRTLNSSKMRARGGKNFGLHETMNNMLWNLVDVPAPRTHWFHFRVVKSRDEVPKGSIFGRNLKAQYEGDFFGMYLALEDYDSRFLDSHDLPDGNLYKLISTRTNGKDVQRNQGKFSVTDASDFANHLQMVRRARDAEWLQQHINYDHYNRYHAIVEAVRHYDVQPNLAEHLKNRSFYFSPPTEEQPLGLQHTLPWDSDTSWGPNWNGGIDYVKDALCANNDDRTLMQTQYKNTVREVRDLIWQPDQINTMLDRLHDKIAPFVLADRDRWVNGTRDSGSESIPPLEDKVADMKAYAWDGGSWQGGNSPSESESRDSGISGQEGRDAYLDFVAKDSGAPSRPTLTYTGGAGFPVDGLVFESSDYRTSIFSGKPFAGMEWRLAEVTDPSLPDYDPSDPFHWEWNATWESGVLAEFQKSLMIPATAVRAGRTYRVRVRMVDQVERESQWSEPIQFTATAPAVLPDLLDGLRVSELMYHPASATEAEAAMGFVTSDFEYIELHNASDKALDLRGVRFTKGIDFEFGASGATMLEAGATVLVVRNAAAFAARYGDEAMIAGEYGGSDASRLSDGGERLKLSFGGGTPIIDFRYNDSAGWPSLADGQGHALVPVSLEAGLALDEGASWVASEAVGGSPGQPGGGSAGPGPSDQDSDGDSMSDAAEGLAGTDPNDPSSVLRITAVDRDAGGLAIRWSSVVGKRYILEHSTDLQADEWTMVAEAEATAALTDARDEASGRLEGPSGYYRVRVNQ